MLGPNFENFGELGSPGKKMTFGCNPRDESCKCYVVTWLDSLYIC